MLPDLYCALAQRRLPNLGSTLSGSTGGTAGSGDGAGRFHRTTVSTSHTTALMPTTRDASTKVSHTGTPVPVAITAPTPTASARPKPRNLPLLFTRNLQGRRPAALLPVFRGLCSGAFVREYFLHLVDWGWDLDKVSGCNRPDEFLDRPRSIVITSSG